MLAEKLNMTPEDAERWIVNLIRNARLDAKIDSKLVNMAVLTHISLASLLWDIGKQYSPRCDAAKCDVPSGALLFAQRNFIEK